MTQETSINNSSEKSLVVRASTPQMFMYYLSFVFLWATIAFIAAMYLMDYEDRHGTFNWVTETKTTEKISFVIFYILQFPFGLMYGLFTGNYNNGLFAFFINPLLIGWAIQKIFFKTRRANIKRISKINFIIVATLVLTMAIYILAE